MIRYQDILMEFRPLVGWQNSYVPQNIPLQQDLTISDSGWYYQDAHPLVTIPNMYSIAPDFNNMDIPEYSPEASYAVDDIVKEFDTNDIYRAKQGACGEPLSDTSVWQKVNMFSEWLRYKTDASIRKVVAETMATVSPVKNTRKTILDQSVLYHSPSRIYERTKNRDDLVGLELTLTHGNGVTVCPKRIGLHFTRVGKYRIYIMHTSNYKPVYQFTFEKKKENTMEWFDLPNVYLPYKGAANDAGGSWIICYKQSELPYGSEAIKRTLDWERGYKCTICSKQDEAIWKAMNKYITIKSINIPEEDVESYSEDTPGAFNTSFNHSFTITKSGQGGIYMWDIEKMFYGTETYGLNLDLGIDCDYTQTIIDNKKVFTEALVYQLGYDALTEFAFNANARINRNSFNVSREDLMVGMEGFGTKESNGLKGRLKKAIANISLDFNGLDKICLPCINSGVKFRFV